MTNQRGQSIVELALTLPILIGLSLLVVEAGWLYLGALSLTHQCDQASIALAHGDNPSVLIRLEDVDALAYTLTISDSLVTDFNCTPIANTPLLNQECMSQADLVTMLDSPRFANVAVVDCHAQRSTLTGFFTLSVYLHHGSVAAR
jgi:hypothetical protein